MIKPEVIWAGKTPLTLLLLPLAWLFCLVVWLRKLFYRIGLFKRHKLPVPVVVIGNISVGGTGKTPLVISLIEVAQKLGFRPGIISRGYGGNAKQWPQPVLADSDPATIGDEPALLARRTGVPVWVGPDRVAAAKKLLEQSDCDLIVSDDGLQHYALGRDMEIAVVDGQRMFGNGFCLPAGPLRERPSRLSETDFVVVNSAASVKEGWCGMTVSSGRLINLTDSGVNAEIDQLKGYTLHAVAGIGNPNRFFDTLRQLGLEVVEHPFPDHHRFTAGDFAAMENKTVIMTEKDAIKCASFANTNFWYLTIEVALDTQCQEDLERQLRGLSNG